MRPASTLRFKRKSRGRWEECLTGDQSNRYLISTKSSKKSVRILPIPRSRSSKKQCSGPSSKSIRKINTVSAQWVFRALFPVAASMPPSVVCFGGIREATYARLRQARNCEIMGPQTAPKMFIEEEAGTMPQMSRRRFLQLTAMTGGSLALGSLVGRGPLIDFGVRVAHADEPIKIGILDPLSSPYKTSSIHDVHGASVAADLFNQKGGVLGRPVAILEADDASNPDQAVKVATKFIKEDRVDALMGTFNGDCALAVSALAAKENKLFMVTGAHIPELTGAACNAHTFVFMPNARMLAHAVVPRLAKAHGTRWYLITASTIDGKSCAQALVDAAQSQKVEIVGETVTPFGATDFVPALSEAKAKQPTAIILN